jgi:addiction module HigA family antidote
VNIASRLSEVPHPGEFIKDELEARGWLQRDLAYILGVSEQAINPIMSGKRGISPEMALALSKAFDISAEYFMNLQKAYELSTARAAADSENKLLSEGVTNAHLRGAMDAHANRADDIWAEFKDRWEGEKKFALREVVKYLRGGKDE